MGSATLALTPLTLAGFLQGVPPQNASLPPFFHTMRAKPLLSTLNNQTLEPPECDVFEKELLNYFFVGRPAYKFEDCPHSDYWLLPIVFAFAPFSQVAPKRIFPFDSGAFKAGRFGKEFSDFEFSDFSAAPEYIQIRKIIDSFYGSNERYVKKKPKTKDDIVSEFALGPSAFPIAALAQLLNKPPNDDFDDRSATIEVQIEGSVALTDMDVLGVVLPEEWLDDKDIVAALSTLTDNVLPYSIYPLRRDAYYAKVYELCGKVHCA